jgi:hypothetical protein
MDNASTKLLPGHSASRSQTRENRHPSTANGKGLIIHHREVELLCSTNPATNIEAKLSVG